MTTLNNIYDNFKTISSTHAQINSFGFGQIYDLATSGTINFPLMYVVPNGAIIQTGEVGYKFIILVADIIEKGKENQIEVLSDTFQICTDIIAYLKISGQQFDSTFKFDIKPRQITLTDFIDKFDEEVAGWQMEISLFTEWNWDKCAIPLK